MIAARILLIGALALHSAVQAGDLFAPMSDADLARQVAITAALAIDHSQTQQLRQLIEAGNGQTPLYEKNPLIRRHFSEVGIRNYFVLSAITSVAITKALPREWRPAYQYTVLVYQIGTVVANKRINLTIKF